MWRPFPTQPERVSVCTVLYVCAGVMAASGGERLFHGLDRRPKPIRS